MQSSLKPNALAIQELDIDAHVVYPGAGFGIDFFNIQLSPLPFPLVIG